MQSDNDTPLEELNNIRQYGYQLLEEDSNKRKFTHNQQTYYIQTYVSYDYKLRLDKGELCKKCQEVKKLYG